MTNKTIEPVLPTSSEIEATLRILELENKLPPAFKRQTHTKTAVDSDRSILKIINNSFAELSLRGKGLCLEQLTREYTKEVNYGRN